MSRECGCGRPTDLYGCRVCADYLAERFLADVPSLVADLEITRVRLDKLGGGNGKRGGETPLMFHPLAPGVQQHLAHTLATWASLVAEDRGLVLDLINQRAVLPKVWSGRAVIPAMPPNDIASLSARWLLKHMKSVRMTESFSVLCREIQDAVYKARRAVDRPPDMAYAGPCDGLGSLTVVMDEQPPCGFDLLADPDWATVRCRSCGYEYDIALRRQWMLDDLRDYEGFAKDVARICTMLGVRVNEALIRKWVQRRKLQPRDWAVPTVNATGQARPLYRVDDVIAVAAGQVVDYEEAS